MKRITVESVCDGNHREETLASIEVEVMIKGQHGSRPVQIDACGQCYNGPVSAVIAMMERAAPPRRSKRVSEGFPCPQEGCEFVGKTAGGLALHTTRKH